MSKIEVLVIDDDENDGLLLKTALKSHSLNPEVEYCQTPEKAYNYLSRNRSVALTRQPQLVFCDYKLGNATGTEVAVKVRSLGYNGSIVMMTGLTNIVHGLKSHSSIDDVIDKNELGFTRLHSSKDFDNNINALIEKGLIVKPLSVGV